MTGGWELGDGGRALHGMEFPVSAYSVYCYLFKNSLPLDESEILTVFIMPSFHAFDLLS